jgi:hypothetical protein
MKSEFTGERFYNRYALALYLIIIATVIFLNEPESSVFELAVGTGFALIWTYLVGLLACFTLFIPLTMMLKKEKLFAPIIPWIIPIVGLGVFLWAIYAEA